MYRRAQTELYVDKVIDDLVGHLVRTNYRIRPN